MIQNFCWQKREKLKLKIKSTILLSKKSSESSFALLDSLVSFSTSVISQENARELAPTTFREFITTVSVHNPLPIYLQVVFASWQTGNDNLAKILVTCLQKWTGL